MEEVRASRKRVCLRPNGGDNYLAYFTESRQRLEVTTTGAQLLDMLCNQELTLEQTARRLSEHYRQPYDEVLSDAKGFFTAVEAELSQGTYDPADQQQQDVPLGVELQINEACNLRCRHCFQEGYRSQASLPIERAKTIVSQLAQAGVFEISIIGGEPLLYKPLEELLEHCARSNLASSLVTNATLLTDEMAAILRRTRTIVNVSLDGVGAVHDRIRGEGVFARADEAIRRLGRHQVPVSILCTLNSLNVDGYAEVAAYAQQLGIGCSFNLFKPTKREHEALILPPERFFEICIDLAARRKAGASVSLSNTAVSALLDGTEARNECTATLSGLVIDYAGRMVTCPGLISCGYLNEDALPPFDENWLETWRSHPLFRDFREHGYRGCQVRSWIFQGDLTTPDPYSAEALREYLEQRP